MEAQLQVEREGMMEAQAHSPSERGGERKKKGSPGEKKGERKETECTSRERDCVRRQDGNAA
jgi:hypothetical protein